MDKWDRDNLNFLLNVDDETFDEFVSQSSADDIDYAIELIQTHKAELMTQEDLVTVCGDISQEDAGRSDLSPQGYLLATDELLTELKAFTKRAE